MLFSSFNLHIKTTRIFPPSNEGRVRRVQFQASVYRGAPYRGARRFPSSSKLDLLAGLHIGFRAVIYPGAPARAFPRAGFISPARNLTFQVIIHEHPLSHENSEARLVALPLPFPSHRSLGRMAGPIIGPFPVGPADTT